MECPGCKRYIRDGSTQHSCGWGQSQTADQYPTLPPDWKDRLMKAHDMRVAERLAARGLGKKPGETAHEYALRLQAYLRSNTLRLKRLDPTMATMAEREPGCDDN